jgi:hypothetical protein
MQKSRAAALLHMLGSSGQIPQYILLNTPYSQSLRLLCRDPQLFRLPLLDKLAVNALLSFLAAEHGGEVG